VDPSQKKLKIRHWSSDSEGSITEPRRKRGKFNKSQHIKEIEKSARQRGEEFVTSKDNLIKIY
jgi:hypothetical protein